MKTIVLCASALCAALGPPAWGGQNITVPGVYGCGGNVGIGLAVLSGSNSATAESGIAITVSVDNVVIDLCGLSVVNNASDANTSTFLYANGRKNLIVRNGSISGYLFGIRLEGNGENYRVENMRVQTLYMGISIDGRSSVVKDNTFTSIGGSHASPAYTMPIAIWARGAGARVTGNTITDVIRPTWYAGGNAYGIYADAMPGGLIAGNVFSNTTRDTTSVSAITIKDMDPARPTLVTVTDNTITNWVSSIVFSVANGKYGGNIIQNSACPAGGTDIGANSCP